MIIVVIATPFIKTDFFSFNVQKKGNVYEKEKEIKKTEMGIFRITYSH